ncbi:hypothetical protein L1987_16604 [Smallanthus sonchifolius]|uniref:Uncharacterized protein n=1 Tax=Smallanthus sonchifolius TaxID=185202 RepID=A0ACB9IWL7_9ASTR|nr:hypothetical protein L1987_16604 [Smallanthus sonchifolius]
MILKFRQKVYPDKFDDEAENMIKNVKQAFDNGEGCQVYRVLDVQRVTENFHVSVHGLNVFDAQMIFIACAPGNNLPEGYELRKEKRSQGINNINWDFWRMHALEYLESLDPPLDVFIEIGLKKKKLKKQENEK